MHYDGTTFCLCLSNLLIFKNVLRTADFCLKILMTHFKIQNNFKLGSIGLKIIKVYL